jgi:hypothetical protein
MEMSSLAVSDFEPMIIKLSVHQADRWHRGAPGKLLLKNLLAKGIGRIITAPTPPQPAFLQEAKLTPAG